MKFYENAHQLVKKELPRSVRSQLYPFFLSGVIAFKEVVNSNSVLFHSEFIPNIKGRLLNYMIYRQFEPDMLSETFPFTPKPERVNNFNYKTLNLLRRNVIINVAKAKDKNSLPRKSKYKLENCRLNNFSQKQLFYNVKSKKLIVTNEPYYLFLTYGVKDDYEIDFVNLIVPNAGMTSILKNIDLMSEFALYTQDVPQEEVEKRITSLKNDVVRKLNIKLKSDGEGDEK